MKPRVPSLDGLTRREIKFLDAYLNRGLSIRASWEHAGYGPFGMKGSLDAEALLRREEVRLLMKTVFEQSTLKKEHLLYRLSEQAIGAWGQYLTSNGTVDLTRLIADGKGYLIQKITPSPRPGGDPTVTFPDSQKALEMLCRALGIFNDRLQVDNDIILRVQYGDDGDGDEPVEGSIRIERI